MVTKGIMKVIATGMTPQCENGTTIQKTIFSFQYEYVGLYLYTDFEDGCGKASFPWLDSLVRFAMPIPSASSQSYKFIYAMNQLVLHSILYSRLWYTYDNAPVRKMAWTWTCERKHHKWSPYHVAITNIINRDTKWRFINNPRYSSDKYAT